MEDVGDEERLGNITNGYPPFSMSRIGDSDLFDPATAQPVSEFPIQLLVVVKNFEEGFICLYGRQKPFPMTVTNLPDLSKPAQRGKATSRPTLPLPSSVRRQNKDTWASQDQKTHHSVWQHYQLGR
jgi:hypothetical protein